MMINLVSSDGKEYSVIKEYAMLSGYISDNYTTDMKQLCIDVKGTILAYIVDYMNIRKGIELSEIRRPLGTNNLADVIDVEDAKFIDDINNNNPCDVHYIISISNKLKFYSLLQLGCAKVASLIHNKSKEEIKRVLNPPRN